MKPFYEQSGITIYHGDCREVLPLPSSRARRPNMKKRPKRRKCAGCHRRTMLPFVCATCLRELNRLHKQWQKKLKPLHDAIEASRRITAKDLSIIVR